MYFLNKLLGKLRSYFADYNKLVMQFKGVLRSWEIDPTNTYLILSRFSTWISFY